MKKTSRDWIQAAAARSGIAVTMPPMPVAAPPKRASDAWRALRHLRELGGRVGVHALALLDPGGRGRRVALRRRERDVLGRAGGIGAQSLPQRGGQLALPRVLPLELGDRLRHAP